MNIGFAGMGIMGSRMAANLLAAGHELSVYNRNQSKTEALIVAGAHRAVSPEVLGHRTEVIITMLTDPQAVATVAEGFLQVPGEGRIWIDCSTIDPASSRAMAKKAAEAGYRFIDAPVAGSKGPAEKGELVFLLGGEAETIAEVQELFDIMGKKSIHAGANGQGAALKMIINYLLAQSMLAFAEGMKLGQGLGLEAELLFNVLLNVPVTAPFLGAIRSKMEEGDYVPNFPLKHLRKDLHLAGIAAYEQGISMPALHLSKEVYAMAEEAGLGDVDFSALFGFLNGQSITSTTVPST